MGRYDWHSCHAIKHGHHVSLLKQDLAFFMKGDTADLLDIRKLIFKYSLHWVKDRARGISGNRNVNTEWLAGHLKQQHRGVPAGLCGTLAGHGLKHRLINTVINNPGVMVCSNRKNR